MESLLLVVISLTLIHIERHITRDDKTVALHYAYVFVAIGIGGVFWTAKILRYVTM